MVKRVNIPTNAGFGELLTFGGSRGGAWASYREKDLLEAHLFPDPLSGNSECAVLTRAELSPPPLDNPP